MLCSRAQGAIAFLHALPHLMHVQRFPPLRYLAGGFQFLHDLQFRHGCHDGFHPQEVQLQQLKTIQMSQLPCQWLHLHRHGGGHHHGHGSQQNDDHQLAHGFHCLLGLHDALPRGLLNVQCVLCPCAQPAIVFLHALLLLM